MEPSGPVLTARGSISFSILSGGKTVVRAMMIARHTKAAKVSTARNLWMPEINDYGAFGRWALIEIEDPWDAKGVIRAAIQAAASAFRVHCS